MLLVSAGIVRKDGKILIAKRKKGKYLEPLWEFPGGKIENNETPEACLKRELLEELDIVTNVEDFVCETTFKCGDKTIKLLAYNAEYVSGELQLRDHDDARWVEVEELKNYEFVRADVAIVDKILKHNKKELNI